MKLRVRSSSGGPTHRIEVPDVSDLRTLRGRIACVVGIPSVNDVHVSLNKRDEVTGPDSVSLSTIGICSGDLLYLLMSDSSRRGPSTNGDSGGGGGGGGSDRSAQFLSTAGGSSSPSPSPSSSSSPRLSAGRGGISHSSGHLSSLSPSSPSPSTSFPSPSSSSRRGKSVEAAAATGSRSRTTAAAGSSSSSPPPRSLGSTTAPAAAAGSTVPSVLSSPFHRADLQRRGRDPAAMRRDLCAAAAIARQGAPASPSSLSGSSSQEPSPSSLSARLPSPSSSPGAAAERTRMSRVDPDLGNQEEEIVANRRRHQIRGERMAIDSADRGEGFIMETSERMDGMDDGEPMATSRSLMGEEGNTSEEDSGLGGDRREAEDKEKGTAMVVDEEALEGGGRGEGGGGGGDMEQEGPAAPDMLERVLLSEIDAVKNHHHLLVIAVHAALLETSLIPWQQMHPATSLLLPLGAGDNRELESVAAGGTGGERAANAAAEDIGEGATAVAAAAAGGGGGGGGRLTGMDVHLPASWSSVEGPLTVVYTLGEVEREERESSAVKCSLCFRQVGGSTVIYGKAAAAADSGPPSPVVHRLTLRHSAYFTDSSSLVKRHADEEQRSSSQSRSRSSSAKRTREPDRSTSLAHHNEEQQKTPPQAHLGEQRHMRRMDEDEEEKVAVAAGGSQSQSQSQSQTTTSSSFPAISQDPRARRILLNARRWFSNLRGLWMEAKDCLALPLLMTLRQRAGLPPPPSLLGIPSDLKMRVLELLPAVDLAAVGRTCSELRFLASDDQLWHVLYVKHFGERGRGGNFPGQTWKTAFARAWRRSVEEARRREEERRRREEDSRGSLVLLPMPGHLYQHPGRGIMGGDYDRLPGGGFGLLGGRGGGDGFGGGFAGGLGGGDDPFGRAREEGRGGEGLRFPRHSPALTETGLLPGLDIDPPVAGGDGFLNLGPNLLAGPHLVQPGLGRGLGPLGGGGPPHGREAGGRVPAPRGPGLHGLGGHGPIL